VRQSWEQVKLAGLTEVGEVLRTTTLALDPEVVALFRVPGIVSTGEGILQRTALRHLFAKVVRFVGCTVSGRYNYPRLVETLTQLGATRAACGAKEVHFEVLRQGLDLALRQVLGDAYTEEVRRAWMTAYSFMSSIMVQGFRTAKGGIAAAAASKDKGCAEEGLGMTLYRLSSFGA